MKKYKLRTFNPTLVYFIVLMILEIFFKIIVKTDIFNINMLYIIIFNLVFSSLLGVVSSLFKNDKINKAIFFIFLFIFCFFYTLEYVVYKTFGFYFDLSLFGAADQVSKFAGDALYYIFINILGILVLFSPFIYFVRFNNEVVIYKEKTKNSITSFIISLCLYGLFIYSLNIGAYNINSAKSLYYETNNAQLNIKTFGVIHALIIDTNRTIFGFSENVNILDNRYKEIKEEVTPIDYDYNNLDIDFDSLIENEKNSTIKTMHEYFKNETGTLQNEYTGFFKNKNLILFMAESFNEIAVDKDLTPTLYKLVNSGFVFDNFYTPTISSTIGGEYQELTGMVAASGFLSPWKSGNNYFPMGIASMFDDAGYNTYAYHDHYYTFQNRNKYLAALGFTNFKGCLNGLEKKINCNIWPESDVEMIETTFSDFASSDKPFFTYYVSVSGHGTYSLSSNAMSRKHKDEVANLPYSDSVKAYIASQIELDRALELLIEKLDSAQILDDTVIALVGDHYPYFLSIDEVNEAATYQKDAVVEVNRSNFIFWNSKMDKVNVSKVGSQIDVLPTIYNAFGLPYDSRLIIGKDILSTEPGLAIFGNASWVSDKGTYFAASRVFAPKENEDVDEDYVKYMNDVVNGKITMSRYIITNDYYRKVFGDK